jgi:hypothetical protein
MSVSEKNIVSEAIFISQALICLRENSHAKDHQGTA